MQLLKESITITLPVTMTEAEVKENNVDTGKAYKRIIQDAKGNDVTQYVFRDITYKVGNSYNMDLPMTGGNDHLQILFGLMGMILILLGFRRWRKTH